MLGSGNLVVTNALVRGGARFHQARHEGGAVCMADGYARVSGRVGVCSVHQGPGLTNTMTGLTEVAKSRTPVLVLAGETPAAALTSNFRINQHGLVESVGAIADRVHSPRTAADDAQRAYQRALIERRPVVLMLPIDIQPQQAASDHPTQPPLPVFEPPRPEPARDRTRGGRARQRQAHGDHRRPWRGPRQSPRRPGRVGRADRRDPRDVGPRQRPVCRPALRARDLRRLCLPVCRRVLPQADAVIVVGASVNHWTTKHGALISDDATVIQIDSNGNAFGRNYPVDIAILSDAKAGINALREELERRGHTATGFRTPQLAEQIATRRWRHEPYEDAGTDEWIDPRTLTIALNDLLPPARNVAVDWGTSRVTRRCTSMSRTRTPGCSQTASRRSGWTGNAIGASIARPDVPTVAALGDGGTFLALPELETAARLKLTLLVLIYDDSDGAEVHHFEPMGHDVSLVRFPETDLAAIAAAAGAKSATVRNTGDLAVVEEWLANRHGPLVLDARVNPTICAEWLEEAFRAG